MPDVPGASLLVAATPLLDLASHWQPVPHRLPTSCQGVALPIDETIQHLAASLVAWLPPEIGRSTPARRATFVAGRLCAERVLSQQGGGGPVPRGDAGEPIWPAGILGSISHTSRMAFAVAMRERDQSGIGIDSETIVDHAGLSDIRSECCTSFERDELFNGSDDEWLATALFSAKESFYKAIYRHVRRFVDFDEVEIRSVEYLHGRTLARLGLVPRSSLGGVIGPIEAWVTTTNATVHSMVCLMARATPSLSYTP